MTPHRPSQTASTGPPPVDLPTPGTFDELDEVWLSAALGVAVEDLSIEDLGDQAGFLGDLARLTFRDTDGEHRLIAKIPTADRGGRRVGRLLDVWWREHLFYTELAHEMGSLVPRCRYSAADRYAMRYVILLDEISPVRPVDELAGASDSDLAAVVDALAVVHGRFHDSHGRTPDWMPGISAGTAELLTGAVVSSLDAWKGRYGDLLPPGFVDLLSRFAPRMAVWLEQQSRRPLVVAHADVRPANLLFGTDGTVRIIDWQTAMRTNGLTDLAIWLATSSTIENRRRVENGLLTRYAAGIRAHGPVLDEAAASADLAGAYLWWSAMFANNLSTIDPPTERARLVFESMVVRTATAALDHDAARVVDAL